jgi:hypothetical protein
MPLSDGISLQNRSRWSRKCPRVPRECSPSLGHVLNVPRVIPRSACSEAAVEPLGGQPTRSEPEVGRGGDSSEVEAESEPWGRARRRPSSGVEAESEPWGRARRRPSSGVEAESEP